MVQLKQNPRLWLKLEKFNPGGSIKDRPALGMVEHAEKKGLLKKGCKIVESSSGNLAVALAFVSAIKGYRFIAVVDRAISPAKLTRLKAYGARIEMVIKGRDANERKKIRRQLVQQIVQKENAVCLDQYNNPSNPQSHRQTAAEILADAPDVDIVVVAVSTGGQCTGIGRALKKINSKIRVAAVEPKGSVIFSKKKNPYFSDGSGLDYTPKNFDPSIPDFLFSVSDQNAFDTVRKLAKTEGILVGPSSGRAVFIAQKLQKKTRKKIVCVCADDGADYPFVFEQADSEEKNAIEV